jgi:hypothetical protein
VRDVETTSDVAERFGLGVPDQISIPVADVDEAAARYAQVFGAFDVFEVSMPDITFRGRSSEVSLKLGFAHCGPWEIELVEVLSGDHPGTEHLATKGETIHHVRFPVEDLRGVQTEMESAGFATTFAGESAGTLFAYLEAPQILGGTSVELIQWGPPS